MSTSHPINAAELDRLFKDWRIKPPIFAKDAENTFIPSNEVGLLSPEKIGYPAPRARLPIPDGFTLYKPDLIAEVERLGLKKIIIAYPTKRLEEAKKMSENDNAKYPSIHWAGMSQLSERNSTVREKAESLVSKAAEKNIEVDFLPMCKLDPRASSQAQNPTRFWTSTKPDQDAAYVLCDDIMGSGATYAAMLSHLTAYGVPSHHMIGSLNGDIDLDEPPPCECPLQLTNKQKKAIAYLRENCPDTAARADIILDLIGVSGMNALTRSQAKSYKIDSATPDPQAVDNAMKKLAEDIHKTKMPRGEGKWCGYFPVPEVTNSFVERVSKVGFSPEPRGKKDSHPVR